MYIQCTKKLLAKLKRPYEELADPPAQQYCWHANLLDFYGVVFVLLLNDYSGDEMVVPLDSFQEFEQKFRQELQKDMKKSGIPEEDIAGYMKEAGPITFGPTSNRTMVARVNGFTQRFKNFTIDTLAFLDEMDQKAKDEGSPLNFGTSESDFPSFNERPKLAPKSKQKAARKPARTLMIGLDVKLKLLGGNKVTRSFLLPIDTNFAALHEILQIGFGWSNTHLHEFVFSKQGFSVGTMENNPYSEGSVLLGIPGMHDEETTMLSDLLPTVRSFTYLYDFGDSWEHVVKVGNMGYIDGNLPLVVCSGGQGSTPPEDCGGEYGFAELLAILKDPSHERYEEVKHWAGYDFAGGFDKDSINKELAELKFTQVPV